MKTLSQKATTPLSPTTLVPRKAVKTGISSVGEGITI